MALDLLATAITGLFTNLLAILQPPLDVLAYTLTLPASIFAYTLNIGVVLLTPGLTLAALSLSVRGWAVISCLGKEWWKHWHAERPSKVDLPSVSMYVGTVVQLCVLCCWTAGSEDARGMGGRSIPPSELYKRYPLSVPAKVVPSFLATACAAGSSHGDSAACGGVRGEADAGDAVACEGCAGDGQG